jgi:GAF domain-containing protein
MFYTPSISLQSLTSFTTFAKKIKMAEDLSIIKGTKKEQYESLIPQISALVDGEDDLIANMGNICASLKEQFDWLWVGFYIVKNGELVLGPFQGPVACTRIKKGRGVCGHAWEISKTVIVDNVDDFPGHIACNSLSKSEIVVPLIKDNEVVALLDVDSVELSAYDEVDQKFLEEIVKLVKF